jgi:hypothetical protein
MAMQLLCRVRIKGCRRSLKTARSKQNYVPCAEHSLNLVGEKAASTVPETVNCFSILKQLHVSFSGSSRSWNIFNTRAKLDVSLNSLRVTGRSAHDTAVASLAMWEQHVEDSKIYFQRIGSVTENKAGAKRLFRKMTKLEYKILTAIWKGIMKRFNKIREKLYSSFELI